MNTKLFGFAFIGGLLALLLGAALPAPYTRQFFSTNSASVLAFSDTGANTLAGWDDTDGKFLPITIGANLTYTHASHTLSGVAQQTQWPLSAITNAGTAVYSNANAFELAGVAVTNGDTRNLSFNGNLDVAGQLNAAHGTMVMGTGTVTIATSASTNQFGPFWNYVFTDAPIGSETNTTMVVSNASHVFISFGAAMSSNASGAGNMTCLLTTNGVVCQVIRIEAVAAGATAFETGFKEFAISLPANCRVGLAFGQTAAQAVNVKNVCLNIKGAN